MVAHTFNELIEINNDRITGDENVKCKIVNVECKGKSKVKSEK